MPKPIVFLDRDGIINKKAPPQSYIMKWDDFEFLPGVAQAIAHLNQAGYLVLVLTNQRGVARGLLSMLTLEDIHTKMLDELKENGATISKVYTCPHEIDQCDCRKPKIGLFLQAERDFEIDKSKSWMIGDSVSDVEAGRRYGVRTIKSENLMDAVNQILGETR